MAILLNLVKKSGSGHAVTLTDTNRAPYHLSYYAIMPMSIERFTATIVKGDRVSQRPACVCVCVRACVRACVRVRAFCDTSYELFDDIYIVHAMVWMKLYFNVNNKTYFFSICNIVIVILNVEKGQKEV